MASDRSNGGAGRRIGVLLIYLGVGAAIFALVAAWDFGGLKLWGKS